MSLRKMSSCCLTLLAALTCLSGNAFAAPPPNDDCSTPINISGAGTHTFDLTQATTGPQGQLNQNCTFNNLQGIQNDVWFCWTADCNGIVDISTCGLTTVDTKIAFYNNNCACPTGLPLCCNDDACGLQTTFTCEVTCGQKYMIQLGKKPGTASGTGSFNIYCEGTTCVCDSCCGKRPNFLSSAGFNKDVAVVTQQSGINTRVVDMINIGAPQPATGTGVNWYAPFFNPTGAQNWTKLWLGTVFGVTIDNLGNVYVAHSSVYQDSGSGGPPGGFGDSVGTIPGGSAGAIYKIDTNTGIPSTFAVLPNAFITGCTTSACYPGLGNLCYSCTYDKIYVSNHEDGRIYRLDTAGTILSTWKHSTSFSSPYTGPDGADTNGFSPLGPHATTTRGQRVWAVRVVKARLFYSVWREDFGRPSNPFNNEIWSVQLAANGDFINGTDQLELTMPPLQGNVSNPVSDISFKPNTCCMLLAERSMQDDSSSSAHSSRLLEYCKANGVWSPSGNNFNTGGPALPTSCAGGCDYDFDTGAGINVNVWATSDAMKLGDPPAADPYIYGIGGMTFSGTNPYANGLLVDSNQSTNTVDKYMQGDVEITCPTDVTTPTCQVNPQGTGCVNACTIPGYVCVPRCIRIGADGKQTVVDCQCIPQGQCHINFGPALPFCEGFCPDGYICQSTKTFDPTDGSTTYCCDCQPDIQHCQPTPDGSACAQSHCPIPGYQCLPKCIEVDFNGNMHVISCDCISPDQCHAEIGPAGPICVGSCPQGQACAQHVFPTPTGTAYCCGCEDDPPFCEPTADGQGCKPFHCPPGTDGLPETCKPRCIHVGAQGQMTVLECDCRSDSECHVIFDPGAPPHCDGNCPPGTYCVQNLITNADGSYDVCCDCLPIQCICPGDIDGNGVLNGLDIAGFVRCWLGQPQAGDNCACADIDSDGDHDNVDISLFVQRILSKTACQPTECCPKANLNQSLATGVDDNGGLITVGQDDDNWEVTLDASGGSVPRQATVITPHPAWQTIPGTQWVSANYFGPNGDYEYRICFCLDDRYKNPSLTIQIRADDAGQVYLNGNFLGNTGAFSAASPATLTTSNPAFFVKGQNCITVAVQNLGGAPTGINMAGTVTALDGKCCCDPADLVKTITSGVYDASGTFIPNGGNDDTWTVICDATGGATPRPAQVLTPHPAWAIIGGTQWISATTGALNGLYCYQYCFCLDPRFKNATLALDVLADDSATIWLNGVQIGATPNGWAFLNPPTQVFVSNQSLFKPCENCIEIRVINGGGVITGMDVFGTIMAEDGLCCNDRPQEELSCCLSDGNCVDLAPGTTQCPDGGTPFVGPCRVPAGCCLPNGTCVDLEPHCCTRSGGTVLPVGTTCTGTTQACCVPATTGGVVTCINTDPTCCTAIYGGTPKGAGTFCQGDVDGNGVDEICEDSQSCAPIPGTRQCSQTQCPVPGEQCQPVCVRVDGNTVVDVLECDCRLSSECHVEWDANFQNPHCVGSCPQGLACQPTTTTNPNGTFNLCCQCDPPQTTVCPLATDLGGQLCAALQQNDCQGPLPTTNECKPQAVITNGPEQGITVQHCSCFSSTCGPVNVVQAAGGNYLLRCVGSCAQGVTCRIHVNGNPTTSSVVNTGTLPAGSVVTCRCAP